MKLDLAAWAENAKLISWVQEVAKLCQPKSVNFYQGTEEEYAFLCKLLVKEGILHPLNPHLRPNSYLCRTHPDDVARVEECTFICTKTKEEAGPTNNWKDPKEMKILLQSLYQGCMKGREMYVIPFCMGPLDSPFSIFGVEITDSPYVVINMHIMTRTGIEVLKAFKNKDFIPCLHSVGSPLEPGQKEALWPFRSDCKYIVHFPEEKSIYSFGSGYGGNALLGKKCLALRIASYIAKQEGWLAEHMLIMGIKNPQGEKKYVAAAFPSACGKTNLAMLKPALKGWEISCVGDDIAWMRWGKDGKLYAINPEKGFFGVAPGTSFNSNPMAMQTLSKNAIFTNVALTSDGDVWWEGMSKEVPSGLITWKNKPFDQSEKAAHPNSRFTAAASQCPIMDPLWESPEGVPISAIILGGRRSDMPLVIESFNWKHGIFLGASLSSETTAAAKGEVGKLRHDPFAMLPFCGYNMGDYFTHWLFMEKPGRQMPKIFHVNWFKKDDNGNYLWPGFGENARVLKWIFERCNGNSEVQKTALGLIPLSLDCSGLNLSKPVIEKLFDVNKESWKKNVLELKEYFKLFGAHLPKAIEQETDALEARLD